MMIELNDASFVAVTTDFWCDRSSRSYLCITGHWFSNDMNIQSKILAFVTYHERHTGENIASQLQEHLTRLKIFDKTTTITCDGASNMKASFKNIDPKIKRLQCLAHKMHLIICNGLGLCVKNRKKNIDSDSSGKTQHIQVSLTKKKGNSIVTVLIIGIAPIQERPYCNVIPDQYQRFKRE